MQATGYAGGHDLTPSLYSVSLFPWEVDPLECPKCHGEMKIISFITEKPVIRKILEHLGLWREEHMPPPNKASPETETDVEIKEVVYEPCDDGWPEYEDFVTVQ